MLRFLIFLLFECSEYLVWHRCADNISTNGSPDYFHRFSSNEIRAYEIEQEYLSAVQDPEPLVKRHDFWGDIIDHKFVDFHFDLLLLSFHPGTIFGNDSPSPARHPLTSSVSNLESGRLFEIEKTRHQASDEFGFYHSQKTFDWFLLNSFRSSNWRSRVVCGQSARNLSVGWY